MHWPSSSLNKVGQVTWSMESTGIKKKEKRKENTVKYNHLI